MPFDSGGATMSDHHRATGTRQLEQPAVIAGRIDSAMVFDQKAAVIIIAVDLAALLPRPDRLQQSLEPGRLVARLGT